MGQMWKYVRMYVHYVCVCSPVKWQGVCVVCTYTSVCVPIKRLKCVHNVRHSEWVIRTYTTNV